MGRSLPPYLSDGILEVQMIWLSIFSCMTLDPMLPFHSNIPCADVDLGLRRRNR